MYSDAGTEIQVVLLVKLNPRI